MSTSLQTSVQAQRIQAIALTVADGDRAKAFYTQALGFEVVSDRIVDGEDYADLKTISQTKIRMITLKLGAEQIRLKQYLDIKGTPIPPDSQSNDLWFQHLAIVVSDMDRAYAHLQSFPIEAISTAPQTIPPGNKEAAYIQAFKFRDPDRHPLELIWFPSGKGQEKWHQQSDRLFLGIDHTAIVIASTEQSLPFYRDGLGMQVEGGSFNWRETQARMDDLPNATVKVTTLRPSLGGLGIELLDYLQPVNGRPMPPHLKSSDIVYVQVELIIDNLHQAIEQFQQNPIQMISPAIKPLSDRTSAQACLIKDPTGHAIMLIEEKR